MSEAKDPAIKLFGQTIQLPDMIPLLADDGGGVLPTPSGGGGGVISEMPPPSPSEKDERSGGDEELAKDASEKKLMDKEEDKSQSLVSLSNPTATSVTDGNPKTSSADDESATLKPSKSEEEQSDSSSRALKKPDKILPCPRCNSMDTKFCYYNNYNMNQPRHFCKNCQRYWTAGGTMRNVPVGAGRRKNKSSTPLYRHISVPEANGVHYHPHNQILKPNGTVLNFGSESQPLCESMASVLKIAQKTMSKNGFHRSEQKLFEKKGEDFLNGSSVDSDSQHYPSFSPQVPIFPGPPWPCSWNGQVGPPFYPPGFPMPFFTSPPPYWACPVPGPWNFSWVSPPPSHAAYHLGPNSPTLGKHSRDDKTVESSEGDKAKENEPEKCIWVPKTLRIDDPDEAARSSIWATLGIKNDRFDSGGLFKDFQSKGKDKTQIVPETSPVLKANPAALSRSLNFQESS